MKVAIIGAGAAGLCAARHLLRKKNISFSIFETTKQVGGTWVYTDKVGVDEHGNPLHSSMYMNLKTNLPKEAMAFPQYPFKSHLPSFITHKDVLNYLTDFSNDYGINNFIKFSHRVEEIHPVYTDDNKMFPQWILTALDLGNKSEHTEVFDAVMVCNGHYAEPFIPQFPNLNLYEGEIIHSHNYRVPTPYAGKTVVVLGAGPSATDISIDLTSCAKSVIMSHRAGIKTNMPNKVEQRPAIIDFSCSGVVFSDGSKLDCDAVMLCTGYEYSFPFINGDNIVEVNNGRVTPLYKHLISINYPSLSFIGLCQKICPFPQFDCQVAYALDILLNPENLPSYKEMIQDEENDYLEHKAKGLADKNSQMLGADQWKYNDELAKLSNQATISSVVEKLYKDARTRRATSVDGYRKVNYILKEDGLSFDVERVGN